MSFVTDFVVIFEKYYTAGSSFTAVLISLSFLVVLRLSNVEPFREMFLKLVEIERKGI